MPVPDELQSVLAKKESTPTLCEKEQRIKSGHTVAVKPQEKLRVLIIDDDFISARADRTHPRTGWF